MILETSWEVCNKMGGIYTVLSSRAKVMMTEHQGEVIFIGPLLQKEGEKLPLDFNDEKPEFLRDWIEKEQQNFPLRTLVGKWNIVGSPSVILVDFSTLWEEKDEIFFKMWQTYGLQSDKGYGDYDESSLFAVAAARLINNLLSTVKTQTSSISIFNEWQTGMGLLELKRINKESKSLFITHATTVGRSICGNGKELYTYMEHYNGDQMAQELNVEAKHQVEKLAAHQATLFATVSELTKREATQLLEREPVVLPNGFEQAFVPKGKAYTLARKTAREQLLQLGSSLLGRKLSPKTFIVSLSGRYEYRNKGIDIFVDSLAQLRSEYQGNREILAFILVPAWVSEARSDVQYLMEHKLVQDQALQHSNLSHWLHNIHEDKLMNHCQEVGLDKPHNRVNLIFVPCYLNGQDGLINLSYYDILPAMDLSLYPSYYEPWGYTPLESIAFGVPSITTNLAGFGLWAKNRLKQTNHFKENRTPVCVIERTDSNRSEVIKAISQQIMRQAEGKLGTITSLRKQAFSLAKEAEWKKFYTYYLDAFKKV